MASSRVRRRKWRMSQNNRLLFPNTGWSPNGKWLIRDGFTDTVAAGSVNGTAATPGPGIRAVTDTGNLVSVGSGVLTTVAPASPGIDPRTLYGAITRTTGLAVIAKYNAVTGNDYGVGLWSGGATTTGHGIGIRQASGDIAARVGSSTGIGTISLDGTAYEFIVVARSTGAHMLSRKTGETQWKLLWVDNAGSYVNAYPGTVNYQASHSIDYLRTIALPAPFATDDGLATDTKSGSVAAGTTFTHEGDFLLEFTVDTLSSTGIWVDFRQQDANNGWVVFADSLGFLILYEYVSGVLTNRASVGGVVSNGHRIVIVAEGTTIKGYSNNTLRWTYSSATNFATATSGQLRYLGTTPTGAVSDLTTYPYGGSLALATHSWPVSVPAGTTFTHEADMLLEFTVDTLPSTATGIRVMVRKQGTNDYWLVYVNQTGGFYLYEYPSGTSRASAAGVISPGDRIVVIAEGTTIKGYSANTLRWSYASATAFATSTNGSLEAITGGAVSDLKTWPRTLIGTAASILNKVSA